MVDPGSSSSSSGLRRELGLIDVAAIFVGIIIGSGIFDAPRWVAGAAPGMLSAALLWFVGGVVAACGAFCYAECASRMPHTGGFYVYFREVYGEGLAFVGGWAAVLVTYPASIAVIALVFARYLGEVLPGVKGHEAWCAAGAIASAGLLNMLGLRLGALAQRVLTGVKVSALLLLCLAALIAGHPSESHVPLFQLSSGMSGMLGAMVGILWTYDGWSDITMIAGEVKDPTKNLGRAVLLGTATLITIYVLVQLSVGSLLAPEQAAKSERVLADAVHAGLGWVSGTAIALLVVVSTLGSINGIVLAASRLGFAVLSDVPLLSWIAKVNARTGAPDRAIGTIALFSMIYVKFEFQDLLYLFSFTVWLFYGLVAVALLVLRRRNVGDPAGWRAPLGPIPPLVVLLTGALMAGSQLIEHDSRVRALTGLGILAAGYPVYWIRKRISSPAGR